MNNALGYLIDTAGFVVPQNPVLPPGLAQNPVYRELSRGCIQGLPCRAQINGMGAFELPLIGATVPGSSWMYLIGLGAIGAFYLMSRRKR